MATPTRRPRQVGLACTLVGVTAVFVLIDIFTIMSNWGSASLRQRVEDAIRDDPFGMTHIDVDTVLTAMRVVLMLLAAGAVAAIVLAVYTSRRHYASRIWLTVLTACWAVVSLVFGITGIVFCAVAVGTLVLLWSSEARAWFDEGRPRRGAVPGIPPPPGPVPRPTTVPYQPSPPPAEESRSPMSGQQPPPDPNQPGPAYPGPSGGSYPGGQQPSYGQQPYQPYPGGGQPEHPVVPARRPGTVTAAAIITLVGSVLAFIGGALITILFLADRDELEKQLRDNYKDSSAEDIHNITTFLGVIMIIGTVLAVLGILVAIMLLRSNPRMRIPLVVLSAITILLGVLTFPLGLLWVLGAVLVIVFCFVGGAGAWFDARNYERDRARQSGY